MFAALDPRYRVAGTPLENVAEEVLNGLFCHYEPPTSEYAQHKAASNVRLNPTKYSFSQVKKSQSILRTSRLYRKKQAAAEARKKRKGVTWRDEQNRKGLEGKVEACAADCDFFGLSTKGGNGLADSLSPTHGATMQKPIINPFPEPTVQQPTTVNTTEQDGPPKKVLYDDEGNPISDGDPSEEVIVDENVPPPTTTALDSVQNQPVIPPAPNGLSQLRKMAKQLDDDDVYEPENYDQPQRAQSLAYKRIRSPPLRKTPRSGDVYGDDEDKITMARSQSPIPNDTPNHYDTPEQFQDHRLTQTRGRPSTPYRRRVEDTDYDSMDNSIVDKGDVKLHTSKSRQQGVPDSSRDSNQKFERTNPVSPARRSEVFSDLTMDEALFGRLGSRYPPVSPAASSEGVEVDVVAGLPRPRSRSPSRYQNETKQSTTTTTTSAGRKVESKTGNEVGRQELTMSRDSSLDKDSYKRREKKTGELSIDDGKVLVSEVKPEKPKTTKTSESGADKQKRAKPSTTKDNEEQKLRKLPSRRKAPAVDTDCEANDAQIAINMKRDPTPRMSSEPISEDTTTNPLPPTPRRKDVVDEAREGKEEDFRKQKNRSIREEREKEEEIIRLRLSRTRQDKQTRPTKSLDSAVVESKTNDWAYNAHLTPFSPKSVATDDEIRAEVSSIGMESETLRPVNYPNPYVRPSKVSKSSKKKSRRDEDASIVRTSSEPSSISDSTLSPPTAVMQQQQQQQQQQTIKKVKSADSGRRSHDVSQASGSTTSKKLWKGWRKAVGKVKAIVKDIDEQRIPPPLLHPPSAAHTGTARQSKHPMTGVKQSQRKSKIPRS